MPSPSPCSPLPLRTVFLFFFFLMTPPPPRSTLFPYTTLFRSIQDHVVEPVVSVNQPRRTGRRDVRRQPRDQPRLDRKSTRLNSSHVEISYAVFCLKKKKKTQTERYSLTRCTTE